MLHIWMGFYIVSFLLSIVDIVVLFFVCVSMVILRMVVSPPVQRSFFDCILTGTDRPGSLVFTPGHFLQEVIPIHHMGNLDYRKTGLPWPTRASCMAGLSA